MGRKRHLYSYLPLGMAMVAFAGPCGAQEPEPPQITAVEPNSAVTTPGAKVLVVGSHLSADAIPYFGGLQAREVTFVNSSTLEAVTPYLRPGNYKLSLKSGDAIFHFDLDFTALAAPVDASFDRAEAMARKDQTHGAIEIFTSIATTNPDFDVRAYGHYRAGELYLDQGDYWRAGEEGALVWDAKASHGVHSSWRYRLFSAEMNYSISNSNDHDADLKIADWAIKWDVTENPELRFWRALLAARFDKLDQAKADLTFILAAEPENLSYRALAAYIGVLKGDAAKLGAFRGSQVRDVRALGLLGQAAYLVGDYESARQWWMAEGKAGVPGAKLACGAGRKHLNYGQPRIGTALIAECATVAADSREGKDAKELLASVTGASH